MKPALLAVLLLAPVGTLLAGTSQAAERDADTKTVRVFIFAGQSNMVGSDSTGIVQLGELCLLKATSNKSN